MPAESGIEIDVFFLKGDAVSRQQRIVRPALRVRDAALAQHIAADRRMRFFQAHRVCGSGKRGLPAAVRQDLPMSPAVGELGAAE